MIGLADQNIVKLASTVRVNEEPRFPLLERLNRCAEGGVEFSEALDCVQLVMGSVLLALKMTAEFDAAHARQLDPISATRRLPTSSRSRSAAATSGWVPMPKR